MNNDDNEINNIDDFIAGEEAFKTPVDIRTFKDGKIITKSSIFLKYFSIIILAITFITLTILFKQQISDFFKKTFSSKNRVQTDYEKQFQKSRAIYATTANLFKFTKNLRPQDIVKGLDVDLFDNERKIKPGNYNIKIIPGSYNFSIILDIQNINKYKINRINRLLKFISLLNAQVANKNISKTFNLFAYYKNKPVEIFRNRKKIDIQEIVKVCYSQKNNKRNKDIIKYTLTKLSSRDINTHQIIYISDYNISDKKDFNSVFLYNFFKKNINYQFYTFYFNKKIADYNNPFTYLKNNHKDFKRAAWNFDVFTLDQQIGKKNFPKFEEILTKAPPVKGIQFEYFPRNKNFKNNSKNRHSLKIKLRKNRRDLHLTFLPQKLYTPHFYLYDLPNKHNFSNTKIGMIDNKTFTPKNEFIVGIKNNSINIQKTIGKIANQFNAEILAGLHNSTFLLKTKSAINFSKKLPLLKSQPTIFNDIRFISQNRYFPGELIVKDKKSNNELVVNWQKRILKQKNNKDIIFKNKIFIFVNGNINYSDKNIKKIKNIYLTPNNEKQSSSSANSTIILETLTRDWNIKYNFVQPIISSSPGYTSKDSFINYTSGFDILNGLNRIISDKSAIGALIFINNSAAIPSLWPKNNFGLNKEFDKIYSALNRLKTIVIAPLPSYEKNINIIPRKNLFTALSLRFYEKKNISYDLNYVPNKKFKQWFPVPGDDIYSDKKKNLASGNTIAAAGLIPIIATIKNKIKNINNAGISDILYNGVALRGDLIKENLIQNRGIICPDMLEKMITNRKFQRKNIINFNNLKKMAYMHIDTILYGKFSNEVHAATGMTAIPYKKNAFFTKTYQYYDRSYLFTGIKQGDALYNLNSKFSVSPIERKELAIITFRGTAFLLCTRNRHRGWILNLESIIPSKNANGSQHIQYDAKNNLIFIFTGHGEIIAVDMLRGLIQNIYLKQKNKYSYLGKSLPTDHGTGNGYFKIDAQNQNMWIYGAGSRYLKLFKYNRQKNKLLITYNPQADCNKKAIVDSSMLANTKLIHRFSPPILFTTGTINIIGYPEDGQKDGVYLKFDLYGNKI